MDFLPSSWNLPTEGFLGSTRFAIMSDILVIGFFVGIVVVGYLLEKEDPE